VEHPDRTLAGGQAGRGIQSRRLGSLALPVAMTLLSFKTVDVVAVKATKGEIAAVERSKITANAPNTD
jgi:hypothetical protein